MAGGISLFAKRRPLLRAAILFSLFVVLAPPATVFSQAEPRWTVEEFTDSMTDEHIKRATITNNEGHTLTIRARGLVVLATFRLSADVSDVLGDRAPIYRVDDKRPVNLELIESLPKITDPQNINSRIYYLSEPKWYTWTIALDREPANEGWLRDLMDGSQVVVRYHPFTGGYKETAFTLKGAQAAIARAAGIPRAVDPHSANFESEKKRLADSYTEKCKQLPEGSIANLQRKVSCHETVLRCLAKARQPDDLKQLERCLDSFDFQ